MHKQRITINDKYWKEKNNRNLLALLFCPPRRFISCSSRARFLLAMPDGSAFTRSGKPGHQQGLYKTRHQSLAVNQTNMASRLFSTFVVRSALLSLSRRAMVNLPVSSQQNAKEWDFVSIRLTKTCNYFINHRQEMELPHLLQCVRLVNIYSSRFSFCVNFAFRVMCLLFLTV